MKNALAGMERSIKDNGYIVLMEPVLVDSEGADEVPFNEAGQCMMVRKRAWYERRFQRQEIRIHEIK